MVILVRYGEIHLKGQNRPYFERLLLRNIKLALEGFENTEAVRGDGRYYVSGFAAGDAMSVIDALKKVFGIHSISLAVETDKDMQSVESEVIAVTREYMSKYGIKEATFKVEAKRSDKRFPMNSMQIASHLGGVILDNVKGLTVDIHKPDFRIYAEIREKAYVYCDIIPGQGGMPVGSSGRGVLMLSGGIDSPVAGYMTAKRGVTLSAVHFASPPYTSEGAKQKVLKLAELITDYTGPVKVHIVPFTEIQMQIYKNCPHEALVIIMRRFMMRIAARIAEAEGAKAIVTGESIGQVASQTLDSMMVTGSVTNLPVIRPLIAMDKLDIIRIAENIGTYETSILPFEDCCTVFVPKHPLIHPKMEKITEFEKRLDVDSLIDEAMKNIEIVDVK